ncbi:putative syf2 splicing factor family protein [Neofusicoccum parvum]|uniref:Pre-mRNA-splicing factor SYF2 n=2 Tax=Neofusicoccum parvum TaxID=310453 RepID=R1GQF0_BOTPV|nr:putative syf2 splicing factor family protein [Neofusicoccum parvum UCRNP2]GME23905.1 putative syf2 splicing factor family protein [Neofusicoccum parvum]GME42520.1 putative syf2 splicing factor family protein [Neofusicoccum parvum]
MPAEKRKTSPTAEGRDEEPSKRRFVENGTEEAGPEQTTEDAPEPAQATPANDQTASGSDRLSRFKALQARQAAARKQNLKDSTAEAQRAQIDPNALTALHRKHAIASHKLLKAETQESGEDFERKRAWDWTVEESERWDRRMEKKGKHRKDVAFQDYRQDARKSYKRQLRDFKPDLDGYERQKMEAVQRAAKNGGLEIVEMEDGELIAVDRDGSFYTTADSTEFVNHRPEKEAVDKLVDDIRKAEEARLKARRARGLDDDSGDVTYINQKNKQFNEKLARFYNKYTADIRDSFERGTAI